MKPSMRSDVAPFYVMEVMKAAAAHEAAAAAEEALAAAQAPAASGDAAATGDRRCRDRREGEQQVPLLLHGERPHVSQW